MIIPTEISLKDSLGEEGKIIKLSVSKYTSSIVINDKDGDHLYMWGDNDYAQQGNNNQTIDDDIETPTEVDLKLTNTQKIKQISMSFDTSSALIHNNSDNTDHLYMWGSNDYLQQGNSDSIKNPKNVS